jgi:hypothetical protein
MSGMYHQLLVSLMVLIYLGRSINSINKKTNFTGLSKGGQSRNTRKQLNTPICLYCHTRMQSRIIYRQLINYLEIWINSCNSEPRIRQNYTYGVVQSGLVQGIAPIVFFSEPFAIPCAT